MSPNPFSLGLSISRCQVPNTLPRYHYCTITNQIPPVYYHYRLVSAIINDGSTAQGRDYWRRGWEGCGLLDYFLDLLNFFAFYLKNIAPPPSRFSRFFTANWDSRDDNFLGHHRLLETRFAAGIQVNSTKAQLFPQCKCFLFHPFISVW